KVSGGVTSTFATFAGTSAHGLAIDSAGNVFASSAQSDNSSSTIYKVTSDGTVSTFGSVPGLCFSLAFDSAGNLFAGVSTQLSLTAPSTSSLRQASEAFLWTRHPLVQVTPPSA